MLKHIVMWNVRGEDAQERLAHIEKIKTLFEAMKVEIPGLIHLEIGIDSSRIDYACDVVLYSEFESQEALNQYAIHPAHQKVKDQLGNIRIARHQVDYQVD